MRSQVLSMIVLKTTQSGFENYLVERYTLLPETKERCLATELDASWGYATTGEPIDYAAVRRKVRAELQRGLFGPAHGGVYSASLQASVYDAGCMVLTALPVVDSIAIDTPNLHYLPMKALEALGRREAAAELRQQIREYPLARSMYPAESLALLHRENGDHHRAGERRVDRGGNRQKRQCVDRFRHRADHLRSGQRVVADVFRSASQRGDQRGAHGRAARVPPDRASSGGLAAEAGRVSRAEVLFWVWKLVARRSNTTVGRERRCNIPDACIAGPRRLSGSGGDVSSGGVLETFTIHGWVRTLD